MRDPLEPAPGIHPGEYNPGRIYVFPPMVVPRRLYTRSFPCFVTLVAATGSGTAGAGAGDAREADLVSDTPPYE